MPSAYIDPGSIFIREISLILLKFSHIFTDPERQKVSLAFWIFPGINRDRLKKDIPQMAVRISMFFDIFHVGELYRSDGC